MNLLKRLWSEEEGATATEYAIIVAVLGAGIIAALGTFTTTLDGILSEFDFGESEN